MAVRASGDVPAPAGGDLRPRGGGAGPPGRAGVVSRPRPWPRSATTGPASAPSRSTGRSTVWYRGRPRSAGQAAVVHVGDSVTDAGRSAWEAGHGLLPGKPTLILGQQSLADPPRPGGRPHPLGLRPQSRHTDQGRRPGRGPRAAGPSRPSRSWSGWKAASRPAPGFRARSWPRGLVPSDLEAADASLAGGDIQAGSFAIDQRRYRPARPGGAGHPGQGPVPGRGERAPGAPSRGAGAWPPARPWPTDRPRLLALTAARARRAGGSRSAAARAAIGRPTRWAPVSPKATVTVGLVGTADHLAVRVWSSPTWSRTSYSSSASVTDGPRPRPPGRRCAARPVGQAAVSTTRTSRPSRSGRLTTARSASPHPGGGDADR